MAKNKSGGRPAILALTAGVGKRATVATKKKSGRVQIVDKRNPSGAKRNIRKTPKKRQVDYVGTGKKYAMKTRSRIRKAYGKS